MSAETKSEEAASDLGEEFKSFVKESRENQRILTNLTDRMVAILAGDKQFGTPGLIQRVDHHEQMLRAYDIKLQQGIGAVKTIMYVGGGIITAIQIIIQLLSYLSGNGAH